MQFGVIGCSTVARVTHIPCLAELPDAKLYASVDLAEDRATELVDGTTFLTSTRPTTVPRRTRRRTRRSNRPHVSTHANIVDTLDAGIYTLVEKPIAATLEDVTATLEAAEESDATAAIAATKRHDSSCERVREQIDDLDATNLITAYDVDPDHGRIIDEVVHLVGRNPPSDLIEESGANRRSDIEQAIGIADELHMDTYDFRLDHLRHDASVLRRLFGEVKRINHMDVSTAGRYASAHLVYEDDVRCVPETGDSDRKWFEEFIRVDGPNGTVEVDFRTRSPRIPDRTPRQTGHQGTHGSVYTSSYDESFERKTAHFIERAGGEADAHTTFRRSERGSPRITDLFRTSQGERSRADREG